MEHSATQKRRKIGVAPSSGQAAHLSVSTAGGGDSFNSVLDTAGKLIAPDGSVWREVDLSTQRQEVGKRAAENVLKEVPGPTPHAKRYVTEDSVSSAWRLFFDNTILEHIRKCTEAEARRQLGDDSRWSLSLNELEAYIGLLYARGVSGAKNIPVLDLWSKDWGLAICKSTMSRNRFLEIARFIRFDVKSTRSARLQTDKFALFSYVWNRFIENCQAAYIPGAFITIDEQLFPSNTRCPFTQFMPAKPDKYGQKYWLAVDVEANYLVNGFPYLGKNDKRGCNERLSDFVVMKLMQPFLGKGRNVTTDNYFTSVELAKNLKQKKTSLLGTVNKARREIPREIKKVKYPLYDCKFYKNDDASLTVYQGKKNKHVILLSTMHSSIGIDGNPKKTPETVKDYNQTKCGVDIVDAMAKSNSVKASSRRWPVHSFYNTLDLAAINAYVVYKKLTTNSLSRKKFLRRLSEELTSENRKARNYIPDPDSELESDDSVDEPPGKRQACQLRRNCKTNHSVGKCKKRVCGKCSAKTLHVCVKCSEVAH